VIALLFVNVIITDEMHWITPLVGGAAPCERSGHTASVVGGRVFIFGGFSFAGGEWLNDTHIFNTGIGSLSLSRSISLKTVV
jgi:hypothetical protein